jgi:hypothetical protein
MRLQAGLTRFETAVDAERPILRPQAQEASYD